MSQFFRYPASGASAANPSTGANGTTAPTSSTEIAGINPLGNLQPLQTNAAGDLKVDINTADFGPLHVIVDSSALPAGGATATLQTAGNTSLATISTNTPAVGQKTMAGSSPVVIASDQSAIPMSLASSPLPTGAATSANQTNATQKTQIVDGAGAVIASQTVNSINRLAVSLAAGVIPGAAAPTYMDQVGGTDGTLARAFSVDTTGKLNVNTISGAISLPTGASTSALQTPGNTSVASIDTKTPALGQALAAGSLPVVLTAAQLTTLTPLATVTANQGAVGTAAWLVQPPAATVANGSVTSAVVLFTQDCSQLQSGSVHITSMGTGNTLTFQVSNDNATWFSCAMMPGGDLTGIIASFTTTVGSFTTQLNSRYFRAIVTVYGSGTVAATAYFKSFGNSPNSVGGYVTAQLYDGAGSSVTLGSKVSASSLPVVIASDQAGITIKQGGSNVANAPIRNDYTVTAVTVGSYVQLTAATTLTCNQLQVFDSSGQTLALATGAAGSEVVQFYIFPGGNGPVPLAIPAGTRVSVKAISANASVGELDVNFFT